MATMKVPPSRFYPVYYPSVATTADEVRSQLSATGLALLNVHDSFITHITEEEGREPETLQELCQSTTWQNIINNPSDVVGRRKVGYVSSTGWQRRGAAWLRRVLRAFAVLRRRVVETPAGLMRHVGGLQTSFMS